MEIRLGDFKLLDEHRKIVNEVLECGQFTEGKYTKLFEEKWAKYIGVKHCIACTNGTAALMLAITAFEFMKQKTLTYAVPATTFPATLNSVLLTGNKSVLVDVKDDLLIDVDKIKCEKIDGIIPVHLFGYPCDMDKIMKLKKKYNLFILEDCCEATGSTYKGKKVGSIGDAGAFSFFMSHPLGIGELGCVTTNNDKLAKIMRSIKNHGRVGSNLEFKHDFIGYNFKTTEFMTALACVGIEHIEEVIDSRRDVVKKYTDCINNKNLSLGAYSSDCSYLGFPIIAKSKKYKKIILEKLKENGIETREMFPCLKNQVAYKNMFQKEYPVSNHLEQCGFYIPCHQYMNEEDINFVIDVINNAKNNSHL